MWFQRNTIHTRKSLGLARRVFGAFGPGARLALNRAEDHLPAGAEMALCFVSLPAEIPEWIELVPAAAVTGSDGRAFVNDKPDDFVALSAQLKRIQAGWCIDFDHQLQLATSEKVGGTAPAAGWIVELQIRNGSIWGRVEWTDLGVEAIQKKRYRGISPVFLFDKESKRALGLVSAALTNNPNLDLVALNAQQPRQQETSTMKKIAELLGLKADATEAEIATALNALLGLAGLLAAAIGVDMQAALALNAESMKSALTRKFGTSDVLVALCTKAGVKTDAGVDAILAALQTPDPSQFVPMAAHMALKTELDKLQGGKPAELVDQALKGGRLFPAQKDWALNYAQRDLEGFKKYIGVTPEKLGSVRTPTTDTAIEANNARSVGAKAGAYVAEQAKLGITVTATQAVAHVSKGV